MDIDDLVKNYPRLYHMAWVGAWDSIREHGLLSTSALLDLYEINGERRDVIESQRRPESVAVAHPDLGQARIRDNKPIRDGALSRCLVGATRSQWYRLLNGHVFFWLTEARLQGLLGARAYRSEEHLVITVDTRRLVQRQRESIRLSPINSGSTLYNPPARGPSTFHTIRDYPFDERRRARGLASAIAELAIVHSVPDVEEVATRVDVRWRANTRRVLWVAE